MQIKIGTPTIIVKFILSIIHSKFQEMPDMKIPTSEKFWKNTIINSKEPKY
jgi:hypothetical protein